MSKPNLVRSLLTSALAAGCFALSAPAHAGLSACGDINVEASAECELMVEGGCEVACTPIHFEGACAAELHAECDGMCQGSLQAECTGSCDADCKGKCEIDPGSFECEGSCNASCEGSCEAECMGSAMGECSGGDCEAEARGECAASCKATCGAECDVSCEGTPPEADCDVKCEASCSGQCKAEANIECQVSCQADGFVECKGRLEGGCKAECTKPEGALFCDGQYIDHGGNLEECISSLNAYLKSKVDVSARGSADASCKSGKCEAEAEGEVSASCSQAGNAAGPSGLGWGLVVTALGLAFIRPRRS